MKSLSKRAFVRSAFAATALASLSSIALAEDIVDAVRPQPTSNVLTLPCCKCTGGTNSFPIHTGLAPWKLISGPTSLISSPHGFWHSVPGAQWIGPSSTAGSSAPAGTYTYQLKIVMQKCLIPSSITIKGQYWGDDEAYMTVSGASGTATPARKPPGGGWGFQTANAGNFSFTTPMSNAGGVVVLTVRVPNAPGGANPTGLLVHGLVTQACGTDRPGPGQIDLPVDKKD
jgi:hypothetical protein